MYAVKQIKLKIYQHYQFLHENVFFIFIKFCIFILIYLNIGECEIMAVSSVFNCVIRGEKCTCFQLR